MSKMKAIIIEDEEPARMLVREFLKSHKQIELIGEYSDGLSGLKAINELEPELIFLDIQMPRLSGMEVLELAKNDPHIIFTTAHDEYAVKAFELDACDYLLKPFSKERFDKAVEKAQASIQENVEGAETIKDKPLDSITVKSNNRINVITLDNINYIEAQDDYIYVFTNEGRFMKKQTMKSIEEQLGSTFLRIHRSYIVSKNQIKSIEKYGKESYMLNLKCGKQLNVSRSRYQDLKETLGF